MGDINEKYSAGMGRQSMISMIIIPVAILRERDNSVKSSRGPECPVCEYINNSKIAKNQNPINIRTPALR